MISKIIFILLTLFITFSHASVASYSISIKSAIVVPPISYYFQDGQPFNFQPGNAYPTFQSVTYDGQDITEWFISFYMQNQQNGNLQNIYAPEIKNTFRPNSNSIFRGEIIYRVWGSWNQNYAKFSENQGVTFPASGSFPLIEKVLYGVPGNDIDMTAWFKNYFMQNQVGGRLVNHPINFNSIYGDPKFEFEFNFKGLMLLNFLKFHILTRE
jgi:hypothetical protein